ncbi:hypothetical protein Tco_1432616, partial [Tanacetum coccineum]
DSEADMESELAEQRPERHKSFAAHNVMVSSFPLLLLLPHSGFVDGQLMTARKRVGPFPTRRLAWRRVPHRSSNCHSSPDSSTFSSSSDSSSNTSSGSPSDSLSYTSLVHSSGYDTSGQAHSGSLTRVTSSRSLDSSSLSARPFCKRCRPPTTLEHMEIGTADAEAIADLGIGDGVGAHTEDGIGMGVKIAASDIREDKEEFEAKASAVRTMEITVDPLVTGGISKSTRGDVPNLEASGKRDGLDDRIRRLGRENLKVRVVLCIERDHVDSLRHHMELSQEEFCQIHKDQNDARMRLRSLESFIERRLEFRP